jgi:hypothetical protein
MQRTLRLVALAACLTVIALSCSSHNKQKPENLPPLKVDPFAGLAPLGKDEAQPFRFRPGPKPPPSTTRKEKLDFPAPKGTKPAGGGQTPPPGELKVLRTSPKGKVSLVGAVTVTFSQPMIPVASLAELGQRKVPIQIEPLPKGRFRWLGTRTVSFEPEGRMPYGTQYSVTIPAGTTSQVGGRLERRVSFRFATPRPRLVSALPYRYGNQARPDTAIALQLNQKVDAEQLTKLIKLRPGYEGGFDLVPRQRWEKLRDIGHQVATWDPERTFVLQPRRPLRKATHYTVSIAAKLRGEGPLTTQNTLYHHFTTYAPLKVVEIRCGDWSHCNPVSGFYVRFNNPLVTRDLEPFIKVTPEPKGGVEINASGTYVQLKAELEPRTRYAIRVDRAGDKTPVDIHDQKLSAPGQATLRTGDRTPDLRFPVRGLASMERTGERKVPLEVVNVRRSRLRMVKVAPEQIHKVIQLARYSWDDGGRRDPLEGIRGVVVRRNLDTGVPRNGKQTLGLATDEALGPRGAGPVYIELRSNELRKQNRWANPFRGIVVQVTDIGVMARYDADRIVAWVSDMQTGKALPGAGAELRDPKGKVMWRGKSDARGLVQAPGRRELKQRGPYTLWVRSADDRAFVILDNSGDDGDYTSSYAYGTPPPERALRMFLFTDRSPYRPGEKVHLKGVLRVADTRPTGGIEPLPADTTEVTYTVTSPRGHKVKEGKSGLSPSGAFAVDVEIPAGADLGAYRVEVKPTSGEHEKSRSHGSFQVQEYRPPEFKVKVEVEGEPYFHGDRLRAKVGADYLFGAPMAGARCSWSLTRQPGHFRPPGHEGFTFGEPVPWRFHWSLRRTLRRHRGGRRQGHVWSQQTGQGDTVDSGQGVLGRDGRIEVRPEKKMQPDPDSKLVGPLSYTLEAQVVDQNRQSIADRKTFTVHPASLYVGLRAPKSVVKVGEAVKVEAVLTDLEGKRIQGRQLTVAAIQHKTKVRTAFEDGRWTYKYDTDERRVGTCQLVTSDRVRSCSVKLKEPGSFLLRVELKDEKGRRTRSALRVYVAGPGYVPWRLRNQSRLELVPDKESYRPGETARVLVKSPLKQAAGLLAVVRGGMERVEPIAMQGNARVIEIPIKMHHVPGVHVSLALARGRVKDPKLGQAARDLGRPTFAHGTVELPVSTEEKQVKVEVRPARETVGPSEKLRIRLKATDSAGKPRRAELAVMLVDEGVLSLLGYETPDPLAFFHYARGRGAPLADLRNELLARQKDLKAERSRAQKRQEQSRRRGRRQVIIRGALGNIGHGGGGGSGSGYGRGAGGLRGDRAATDAPVLARRARRASTAQPSTRLEAKAKGGFFKLDLVTGGETEASGAAPEIRARTRFATTAYYNPSVVTDRRGAAELTVKMPDNTTTYRIMVVALDRDRADQFGNGEAQVKVRKPVLLRPSLPRFLSVGDSFEAAVMVHNQTAKAGAVDVLVRGRNATPVGKSRVRVTIPADGAREVRFSMAVKEAGPARIQFAAVLGSCSPVGRAGGATSCTDAVEKQLPVLLPVTTEAFATYGMTDGSVEQPVVAPKNALGGYGGLEVSMSSTALNGLEDSVRYLVTYPHECTEQTASRVLPIFSLSKILGDFSIGAVKDQKTREALAGAGVRKLISYQRWDGGWGNWRGSRISWPYTSAYATYALLRARKAGETVPEYNLRRARAFLKQRLDHPRTEFGEQYDWVAQVASAWVLSEMKQHERGHLGRLYGLRKRLPLFARTWLMVALFRAEGHSARVKEVLRELDNAAVQTASAAHFAEGKSESLRLLMHSNDRTDAIVLQALLEVAPEHPLMPKIARGLLQSRVKGSWSTTQANAFALVALARYYRQVERTVPDHVSQIWYGDGFMGQGTFRGREMKVVQQKIPLAALRRLGDQSLVLSRRGRGKLYYRIGLRYAPTDLTLPPEEQGFAVSRLYEPIKDARGRTENTVRRRPDGTWEIKAGSTVRVRVVLVVPDRRYFVAIADPLPAGLEGVNLGFKTSARTRLSGQLDNQVYDTWSWYSMLAFDHREMRDDRVVLFADRLPAGVYEYTYLARATTFGSFVVAPTKAEEMYHPETFGRAGTTRVHVVK